MPIEPNQVKAIFLTALEKASPTERLAYLDEACANDSALRQRVEALLKAHDAEDSLLERPIIDPGTEDLEPVSRTRLPDGPSPTRQAGSTEPPTIGVDIWYQNGPREMNA